MPINILNKSTQIDQVLFIHIYGYGELVKKDVDEFGINISTHMNDGRPLKLFFDTRKLDTIDIKMMPYIVKQLTNSETEAREKILASAILVQNASIENIIKMLFKLREPVIPIHVTSKIDAACNFLNEY